MQDYSKNFALLKNLDDAPDTMVLSMRNVSILLGLSERSVRYHPTLRRVMVSKNRYGFRVSDIRAVVRGEGE